MIAPFGTTPLDPEEITSPPHNPDHLLAENHRNTELCQTFRHSFWSQKRVRIFDTLCTLYPGDKRLDTFQSCGTFAWVMKSKTRPGRYRIRTNKCRDRFCDACAGEKRRLIAANLARQLPKQTLRFLTFTLKSSAKPLNQQIDRLYHAFRTLRTRKHFKTKLYGGITFLELTINLRTGLWHPHLHVLASGQYIPKNDLQSAWFSITKDSFVTDIRIVTSPQQAAGYLTKYASKTIPAEVWHSPKHLAEVIEATSNRRTFNTFGTWKNLELSKTPDDKDDWIDIAPLHEILRSASIGDPIANDILLHLRRESNIIDEDPTEERPP